MKTTWTNSPLYDVVLGSRHPAAVKLFECANSMPKTAEQQVSMFDMLA